jgi:DNA repair protein RadA/Sms
VIAPVLDGNRSLLVEVQALVAPTHAPIPRRVAQSLDGGRVSMLTAVLGRRAGVELGTHDIYVNIAGGARASEPGADLAIALAIAAAAGDQAVADDTVVLGEVGLGGELRQVAQTPRRLSEAARHGFARAVVPASTPDVAGIRLVRAADLRTALTVLQPVRSVRVC